MWLRPVQSDVMALLQASGAFANPLRLLGLMALVPLVLLYLVRPDPRRYALPTVEFLTEADGDSRRQRLRDRIHVPTVLLLQATVLIAIPLALAGPQVPLPGDAGGETVVVLDNSALLTTIDRLNDVEPSGEADPEAALAAYAETIASRSVVVLASDCLVDPDAFETGLDALSDHHVVVVHVVAPEELEPPVEGETIFEGLEAETSLQTYFSPREASRYRERLEAHWSAIESVTVARGGEYVRVRTDEAFYDAFERAWIG